MKSRRSKTRKAATPAGGGVVVLTREGLEKRADEIAADLLKVSRVKAFQLLDKGKLRGTLAEAQLSPIRALLK